MEERCPCCDRHCPAEQLSCPRGQAHFSAGDKGSGHRTARPVREDEKMIVLLRKCGHFLHHNVGMDGDTAPLVNALCPEERAALEALLEKCLESWNASAGKGEK